MLLFGDLSFQLLLANLIVLFFGMGLHEYAHSMVAHWMGDPTPREMGRLTPNPLVHIYWPGWLMFAIIGFGILGFAPINPRRMRNPRWGALAATAAGPLSNLIFAILAAIFLRIIANPQQIISALIRPDLVNTIPNFVILLLVQAVYLNVLLFVFNLLPLFPIDGWHIVFALLPPELAYSWQRHKQTSQMVFLGVLLLSFVPIGNLNIIGTLIGQPTSSIAFFLMGF